jgi:glyoxylase-like metal-dependent hydrolase (beta-lactamase superfamily II)
MPWRVGIIEVGVIPEVPRATYFPDASPDILMEVPCYCFLVTDGHTHVLVDTGPDPVLAAKGGLAITGPGPAAVQQALDAERISANDVDYILHTHLHYDHIENDLLFPRAEVFVQARELVWARNPDAGRFYVGVEELVSQVGDRLNLLDGEREVLDGIRLVPNGGHTPGHQSVLVTAGAETVCVCGDIVPMTANLEVLCSATPDLEAAQAFLHRARGAGWTMVPAHEPALREHRWLLGPARRYA